MDELGNNHRLTDVYTSDPPPTPASFPHLQPCTFAARAQEYLIARFSCNNKWWRKTICSSIRDCPDKVHQTIHWNMYNTMLQTLGRQGMKRLSTEEEREAIQSGKWVTIQFRQQATVRI